MAELIINSEIIEQNISWVRKVCAAKQLDIIGVVKCCDSFAPLIGLLQENSITRLGLSRVKPLEEMNGIFRRKPMLVTMPSMRNAGDIIRLTAESLNSETRVIDALADAALRSATEHKVIVMVEVGELREGVEPKDALATVRSIVSRENGYLRFGGIAANLGCSGAMPSETNIGLLNDMAGEIESQLCPVETVSLGGSVMLDWLDGDRPVGRVNQVRVGEAIFLGTIPNIPRKHHTLRQDAIILRGEVLEVKEKRIAKEHGRMTRTVGNEVPFRRIGVRRRAILNFGVVDTVPSGLSADDDGIRFVTCSSDYSIFDVTDCMHAIRPGDLMEFRPNYYATAQAFLSPHSKIIMS